MQIGFLVLRTRSSTARHFALNSEIAISSITSPMVTIIDHSHNNGQCDPPKNVSRESRVILLSVPSVSSVVNSSSSRVCTLAPFLLKAVPSLPRRSKLRLRSQRIRPRLLLQLQQQRQIFVRRRLQNLDRLLPTDRPLIPPQVPTLLPTVIFTSPPPPHFPQRTQSH